MAESIERPTQALFKVNSYVLESTLLIHSAVTLLGALAAKLNKHDPNQEDAEAAHLRALISQHIQEVKQVASDYHDVGRASQVINRLLSN